MLILVIIAIILVVSFGLNMYVEENNKGIYKGTRKRKWTFKKAK